MKNMRVIKRIWGLLVFSGMAALIIQCSKLAPTEPVPVHQSSVAASIHINQKNYTATDLDSLILEITGDGVKTIRHKIVFDGTKAQDQLQVPANKPLTVSATGYQDSTAVLYGSKPLEAQSAGQINNVRIVLDFLVPTIILTPPDSVIQKDQQIEVFLSARNVVEMATFGCLVRFDPTVLQVVELGRQDDFLTLNRGAVTQLEFTQDNLAGTVRAVLGVFPASSAVSGSGNVGRILFKAIKSDTTDISIQVDNSKNSDLGLFNKNADLMYSVGLGSRLVIENGQPL
jgi:hypothetical protein